MTTILSKSIYLWRNARMILLGLAALSAAASPLFGQETVAGKFTLTESTHFGSKVLPAGRYKFSVESVASIQTVNSIPGGGEPVLVIMTPETNAAPVTSMFAMASRSVHPTGANKIVLEQVSDGMAVHAMYLDQPGLVLDFGWMGGKVKAPTLAAAARQVPAPTSKATD